MAEVEDFHPDWQLLYISEVDHTQVDGGEALFADRFRQRRYWPGPGSWPMTVVFRGTTLPFFKSTHVRGRCMSVHLKEFREFREAGSDLLQLDITLLFLHGCHLNLGSTLSDMAFLRRKASRLSRIVMLGDWNVDLLVHDLDNRNTQHINRRPILDSSLRHTLIKSRIARQLRAVLAVLSPRIAPQTHR